MKINISSAIYCLCKGLEDGTAYRAYLVHHDEINRSTCTVLSFEIHDDGATSLRTLINENAKTTDISIITDDPNIYVVSSKISGEDVPLREILEQIQDDLADSCAGLGFLSLTQALSDAVS